MTAVTENGLSCVIVKIEVPERLVLPVCVSVAGVGERFFGFYLIVDLTLSTCAA